jgi:lipopolysaccharide export system permease protein
MRIQPPILYRYILKELLTPFGVILFIFTGLLFLARSLKLVELIVNKTASLLDIVVLFSYIIPQFLEMAIPMAFLLSIIIAFSRLSADSELVVMRSVGFSLSKLILPVALFALTVSIFSASVSLVVRPWANYQLGLGLFRLATAQASSGLIEGSFNEIGPLTIYAREVVNQGALLKDVIISDRRNPDSQRIFFANRASIRSNDTTRTVMIQLFDGSMHEGTGSSLSQTEYAVNSIRISESEMTDGDDAQKKKKISEMSTQELRSIIADTKMRNEQEFDGHSLPRMIVELQKRLVLPFSCLCVALLALSLGIQPSRGGNRFGMTLSFIAGIIFILAYYISFALVSAISETSGSYIALLMWFPNILFFILGALLFRQVGTERWTAVTDTAIQTFLALSSKFSRKSPEVSRP